MSVERIIGIDFGTSTSVVKIKTYKDNLPVDAKEIADYVRFDNKDTLPTLVYETNDGRFLFGYEAENASVKGVLHQNFKLDLISTETEKREKALQFTDQFLKYLFDTYTEQKNYFPTCDTESTYISYPAKWSDSLRETMIKLVQKVGFKNVKGLDEPTAAVHTVMVQQSEKLTLNSEGFANILMVDMGAGTTDLVLARYSPMADPQISILNVWPKADSASLFGGREIDEVLCEYVKAYLVNCGLPNSKNFREKYIDKCKVWKETNISPVFKDKNGVIRYCGFVDSLTAMMSSDIEFPPLSRDAFEEMIKDKIVLFTKMINDCLEDADFSREDLDYVILTGGHSQWYFTNEILDGSLLKFGRVVLPKIQQDKNRVIKLSRPQETVALGLVYQGIKVAPVFPQQAGEQDYGRADEIFCGFCGFKRPASTPFCPGCGRGNEAEQASNAAYQYSQYQNNQNQYHQETTYSQPYTAPTSAASTPLKSDVYVMPEGKNLQGLADCIYNLLSVTKSMDTQAVSLEGGSIMLQARDKAGKWKQWIGMDKAITVNLVMVDDNRVSVNIGESKWMDKVGVMAVSMIVLWPLTITSGIGMYIQGKLPGEIRKEVQRYFSM